MPPTYTVGRKYERMVFVLLPVYRDMHGEPCICSCVYFVIYQSLSYKLLFGQYRKLQQQAPDAVEAFEFIRESQTQWGRKLCKRLTALSEQLKVPLSQGRAKPPRKTSLKEWIEMLDPGEYAEPITGTH